MQFFMSLIKIYNAYVSIPQAVWIACNIRSWSVRAIRPSFNTASGMDCMQFVRRYVLTGKLTGFNTASGMDCMQCAYDGSRSSSLWFQYRKRYGLHAIRPAKHIGVAADRFNTASGMDCMQFRQRQVLEGVSSEFQYRKRYGLHAILSPGSLGNSEPKNRVSNDDPLFAFFPKVSGTFLSRKVLRKGLEASHSKGTFVHERNLILMAFSLDFRASSEQSIS